jgi:hypothetical protein
MYRTMTGVSTSVSELITYTGFLRSGGGKAANADHTIWSAQVESLPPLYPTTHGRLSDK